MFLAGDNEMCPPAAAEAADQPQDRRLPRPLPPRMTEILPRGNPHEKARKTTRSSKAMSTFSKTTCASSGGTDTAGRFWSQSRTAWAVRATYPAALATASGGWGAELPDFLICPVRHTAGWRSLMECTLDRLSLPRTGVGALRAVGPVRRARPGRRRVCASTSTRRGPSKPIRQVTARFCRAHRAARRPAPRRRSVRHCLPRVRDSALGRQPHLGLRIHPRPPRRGALHFPAAAGPEEPRRVVAVEPGTFDFSTGGPAIATSWPGEGEESIDEEQAFVVVLDGDATPASIEQHVFLCRPGHHRTRRRAAAHRSRARCDSRTFDARQFTGPVVVLQARQRFPNGATVRLVWGRGWPRRAA